MKTIELFGNIYEEVEDGGAECVCASCALLEICNTVKPDLPCERADGSVNRHFILVDLADDEKLNGEE